MYDGLVEVVSAPWDQCGPIHVPSWSAPIVGTKPTDIEPAKTFLIDRIDSTVGWTIGCGDVTVAMVFLWVSINLS